MKYLKTFNNILFPVFFTVLTACTSNLSLYQEPEQSKSFNKQPDKSTQNIKKVFSDYQKYYSLKTEAGLIKLMDLYADSKDDTLIWCNAITPQKPGWIKGRNNIYKALIYDWNYWNNIKYHIDTAQIDKSGNIAWIAMQGTFYPTKKFSIFLNNVEQNIIENIENTRKTSHLNITYLVDTLQDAIFTKDQNGRHVVPFVATAILIKENEKWKIIQMHHSLPANLKKYNIEKEDLLKSL